MIRRTTLGRLPAPAGPALLLVLAASLALAAAACGGGAATAASPSPSPLRIGAIYNLTGSQSSLDGPSLDGARLAADSINAAGGVMGRRVELLERDGQTNTDDVRRAAESLVASGVSAIIGLSDTDQVLAAAPVAAQAGIPFVTSGATSPLLPQQVPTWLFLAAFGDNAQAGAGAEYAYQALGLHTAAVVFARDLEYTKLLARYFSEAFRSQGGRIVLEASFQGHGKDVAALLGAPDRDHPGAGGAAGPTKADLIYIAAGPDDAGPLVRRLRAAGVKQPLMGGDSFDSSALVTAARQTGGGVYFTTHAAPGLLTASAAERRFTAEFGAAYGRPPQNAFALLGYDTVGLVAAAVERADSVQPSEVRDALQKMHRFVGVTGTISYVGGSHVPRKRVTLVRVGRRPEVVAEFTPQFVPKP